MTNSPYYHWIPAKSYRKQFFMKLADVARFGTLSIPKDIKIALLIKKLQRFCKRGGFCRLVELYRELHHWFKSYRDFAKGVDFADWWNCIEKDLRLQPGHQTF